MTWVVVGARGTLGARLVAELDAEGVDFRADDPDEPWRECVAAADVVINVGGPRVRPGLEARDYAREHVGVAERVLGAMHGGAHLVHVSSTAVFGTRGAEPGPDTPPSPDRFPMPGYASAKLAAENALVRAAPARAIGLTVLRPSMVYGEGVESALDTLLRFGRRGVALDLRPPDLRQHLVHVSLFVAAVRAAATREADGPRPILLADPFVLRDRDVLVPAPLRVPVPLRAIGALAGTMRSFGKASLRLDSFAVLAQDIAFRTDETWPRLGLDAADFARARTFDRYFAS